MAIAPKYIPPPRFDGFTLTVSASGTVPEVGFTASQFPPVLVEGVAVNACPLTPLIVNCWLCETTDPVLKLNVRAVGVAEKFDVPLVSTLRITGTLVFVPVDMIEMKPPYEPAVSEPAATDTVKT
jgi:hypothetical protein